MWYHRSLNRGRTVSHPRARSASLLFILLGSWSFLSGFSEGNISPHGNGHAKPPAAPQRVEGGKTDIGGYDASTWAELDAQGRIQRLVLALPDSALSLGQGIREYVVRTPRVEGLPFDHVGIDWMPHGHAPDGVYNVPHFDVHFYMMTQEERDAITLTGNSLARAQRAPELRFIPEGYISTGDAAPKMGMHWVDPSSPEFNGSPFRATFIYGFYDGSMTFMELMFAQNFLLEKPTVEAAIKQPQEFERKGYYPTRWKMRPDAAGRRTLISYEDFVRHD